MVVDALRRFLPCPTDGSSMAGEGISWNFQILIIIAQGEDGSALAASNIFRLKLGVSTTVGCKRP